MQGKRDKLDKVLKETKEVRDMLIRNQILEDEEEQLPNLTSI